MNKVVQNCFITKLKLHLLLFSERNFTFVSAQNIQDLEQKCIFFYFLWFIFLIKYFNCAILIFKIVKLSEIFKII